MKHSIQLLLFFITSLLTAAVYSDSTSKSDFSFALTRHDQARLSPDGEYIAAITTVPTYPETYNLVTMRLADSVAQAVTGFSTTDVESFFWVNDKRIVFSTDHESGNSGLREYRGSFTIDRDGTGGRKLQQQRIRSAGKSLVNATAPRLLHRLSTDWNNVLISRTEVNGKLPQVSLLNINTGRTRFIDTGQTGIARWIVDNSGYVRAAIDKGVDVLGGNERLWFKDTATSEWRELIGYNAGELEVLAFSADNRHLIVLAPVQPDSNDNIRGLYRMDANGKRVKALVLDPDFDAGNLSAGAVGLKQTSMGYPVYYQYMTDKLTTVYFDSRWEARQKIIDEALADTVNTIVDWSDDERKLLIRSQHEQRSNDYYVFETIPHELKLLEPPSNWVKAPRQ